MKKILGLQAPMELASVMAGEPAAGNIEQMKENVEAKALQKLVDQWSPFELLMIQKIDTMFYLHQEYSVEIHSSLENITTQLENI